MAATLVVSPHLDDAVLSCAHFLQRRPGTVVVTVFAGSPPIPVTAAWDTESGFRDSTTAMAQRRREDLNALAQVYAAQRLLGYLDGQYQERRPPDLVGRIGEDLARLAIECAAELVLIPLGLEHADHRLASDAGRRMVGRVTAPVIAYMDLPYGLGDPAIAAARLEELDNPAPWQPGPSNHAATREGKLSAVSCYASQIAPLQRSTSVEGQWERTFEPQSEMFWILSPRVHG